MHFISCWSFHCYCHYCFTINCNNYCWTKVSLIHTIHVYIVSKEMMSNMMVKNFGNHWRILKDKGKNLNFLTDLKISTCRKKILFYISLFNQDLEKKKKKFPKLRKMLRIFPNSRRGCGTCTVGQKPRKSLSNELFWYPVVGCLSVSVRLSVEFKSSPEPLCQFNQTAQSIGKESFEKENSSCFNEGPCPFKRGDINKVIKKTIDNIQNLLIKNHLHNFNQFLKSRGF